MTSNNLKTVAIDAAKTLMINGSKERIIIGGLLAAGAAAIATTAIVVHNNKTEVPEPEPEPVKTGFFKLFKKAEA